MVQKSGERNRIRIRIRTQKAVKHLHANTEVDDGVLGSPPAQSDLPPSGHHSDPWCRSQGKAACGVLAEAVGCEQDSARGWTDPEGDDKAGVREASSCLPVCG